MLKIVIFDCGYGGEFFADQLEEELPVADIIRVIDWRNADKIQASPKLARKYAEKALHPYLGKTDLIIFANHLLTITSLKYFKRKYKNQKFIGLKLKKPDTFIKHDILILTTKPVSRTIAYRNFLFRLKRKTKTLLLDDWPLKIDDGELSEPEIQTTIKRMLVREDIDPKEIILACSQFNDIKNELKGAFQCNVRIYDSFNDAIRESFKVLNLRGGIGKKKYDEEFFMIQWIYAN